MPLKYRMETSAVAGWAGLAMAVLSSVYVALKHSSCKTHCCGREADLTIDLSPVVAVVSPPVDTKEQASKNQIEEQK